MNLDQTMLKIENEIFLTNTGIFNAVLDEDGLGGWHPDPDQRKWTIGSVFEVEGKILYALVRKLQPKKCVEIGIQDGCSASHIALALKANSNTPSKSTKGQAGKLTSIDRANSGTLIPDDLCPYVTITGGDGAEWLAAQKDKSIDFLFEDADHSEDLAYRIGVLAQSKLKVGGLFVAHDAAHATVGADICAGYTRAGLDYRVYLCEPSDCGLAIWRRI